MKTKLALLLLLSINTSYSQHSGNIPTQQEYAQALISALGSSGPRLTQMIGALSAYCGTEENFSSGMGGNCDRLFFEALEGNGNVVKRVLRNLRPREVIQSARTSVAIVANQQANLASRLAQIRSGLNNHAITLNNNELPLSALGYLADNSSNSNDFVSPWGFFINGKYSAGDYTYADGSEEGFDFDTNGITAGIDYRLNNKAIIGLAFGYSSFDSIVDTSSTMQSSATTYSVYGSYNFTDNFYLDARLSHSNPDFEQQRFIDFSMGGSVTDLTANGETDGYQDSYILSAGYQFNSNNGWMFTPSISTEYSKTAIDAFVETGANAFNVGFSEQNFKTKRYTLALQTSKSISLSHGVIIPSLNYVFINEDQNTDAILMRISGMPSGEFFEHGVNFNDDNYSTAQLGLTYVASNGKQAYIQYSKAFGWQGFDRYSINLGLRFEF